MDKIVLKGIKIFAYHGVGEDEKQNGQYFYIDTELFLSLEASGISDNVDDTVNYASVCEVILKKFTEKKFDLIEAAAKYCTDAVLETFPKVEKMSLTVHKPDAPINVVEFTDAAVYIERVRKEVL